MQTPQRNGTCCLPGRDSALVVAMWGALCEGQPRVGSSEEPCLTHDQLAELANLCFWASLEVEEGRQVRGTVCVCRSKDVPLARVFTQPIPLSIPALAKLLIATPSTPLAVRGGADGIYAWSLLDSEPESLLRLRITGQGTLLASQGRRILALLNRGVEAVPVASDEASLNMLLAKVLDRDVRQIESDEKTRKMFRIIASSILAHGHGGTLVIVPALEQAWRKSVRCAYGFDDPSAQLLRDSVQSFETDMQEAERIFTVLSQGNPGVESLVQMRKKFEAALLLRTLAQSLAQRVGDLSRVDGAVLMDTDLRTLGFGVKLLFGQGDFFVTTVDTVTGLVATGVELADLGGMRHQSAAHFVQDNRTSEAIVVSQDGRISLFTWSESHQTVTVLQRIEHFMWEHQVG